MLLAHPTPGAAIVLTTDASDVAVGAVVEQSVGGVWQPLALCSCKLRHNEQVQCPTLLCDVSTGCPCPVVSVAWGHKVFDLVHPLSHPGVWASVKLFSV